LIHVTKPFQPDLELYQQYIAEIHERNWWTNHGPLVTQLEEQLREYLGVKHLILVNNGTIALQIAIKALELNAEVITTPFSYVATTSALVWEQCKPVFADIDAGNLCLDAGLVKAKINEKTQAIMATHVFGNCGDVDALESIAAEHDLPIIFDAAHAFGTKLHGSSLLNRGTVSTLSFHATKLFHTVEGGAIITNDKALAHKMRYLRNFGHHGEEEFWGLGVNGKMSEPHAAMGLALLPRIPEVLSGRQRVTELYDQLLDAEQLSRPDVHTGLDYNYAYYPVLFKSEDALLKARTALLAKDIKPRRYFYPSLNTLPYVGQQEAPVSEDIASRILCLPIYPDLSNDWVKTIAHTINQSFSS